MGSQVHVRSAGLIAGSSGSRLDYLPSRILVVDDEANVREIIRLTLGRGGYEARCLSTGAEAIKALGEESYFAILMDLLMPEMDGLELLRHVKRDHPGMSIIAMTGSTCSVDYLDIALKLGADDVIRKPFRAIGLVDIVAKQQCLWQMRRDDERRYVRLPLSLDGQILDLTSGAAHLCRILNISAGGALVTSQAKLKRDGKYVLFNDHFGRFEVRLAHARAEDFGLEFLIGNAKRGRLQEMLNIYMVGGADGILKMRQSIRVRTDAGIDCLRSDGEKIPCAVIDISLGGASLKASSRPPIGEVVTLGKSTGRVVRHHSDGFALQFIRALGGEFPIGRWPGRTHPDLES